MFVCIKKWYPIFQSALPRGERPDPVQGSPEQGNFNPRSHEGSDFSHLHNHLHLWNFNPRSHEGSDICFLNGIYNLIISIRAPTRGATLWKNIYMLPGQISIRAPTRGATGTQWKSTAITTDFNPRSHEGSD